MSADVLRNHNYKIGRLIPKYHDVIYTLRRYIQQFKHVMTNHAPDRLEQEDDCVCERNRRNKKKRRLVSNYVTSSDTIFLFIHVLDMIWFHIPFILNFISHVVELAS